MIAPTQFEAHAVKRADPAPFDLEERHNWELLYARIDGIKKQCRTLVKRYEGKNPALSLEELERAKALAEFEANQGEAYDISPEEFRTYQAELVADQRKAALFEVLRAQVGTVYTDAERPLKARAQLNEDTEVIAQAFAAQGAPAFKSASSPRMAYVGLVTGTVSEIPHVRSRCIFPIVGQMKRSKTMAALEYWLKRNRRDRFWTFTLGPRCIVSELRDNLQQLHRMISKLNHEAFMRDAKQKFIFRASEIGSLRDEKGEWKRDDCGNITYHPHAHALLHGPKLTRRHFSELLKNISAWWKSRGGGWCKDCGGIEKVREVVKYVGKPADLRALCAEKPAELVQLADALFRLKMIQPLAGLKEQIASRKKRCRKLAAGLNGLEEKADWNARKFKVLEREKGKMQRPAGAVGYQGDFLAAPQTPVFQAEERHAATRPMENRVFAILPSLLLAGSITEPAVLVANYDGNLCGLLSDPLRRKVVEIGRAAYQDGPKAKAAARMCAEAAKKGRALVSTLTPQLSGANQADLPGFDCSDIWTPPKTPAPPPLAPVHLSELLKK